MISYGRLDKVLAGCRLRKPSLSVSRTGPLGAIAISIFHGIILWCWKVSWKS